MKLILSVIVGIFACLPCNAQHELDSEFYDGLQKVEAKYRAGKAALIKKADRVIVYLVDFDGITERNDFADEDESISIAPYNSVTKIIDKKEIDANDRKKLLDILSAAIAEPEHSGGAMCHFPIHGVRVYAGEELLYEGTFCWVCGNFSYSYPQGSSWLDTNAEIKAIFTSILPVPQAEIDRFHEKYPGAKPKGEQADTVQPATRPESKSEGGDKPKQEAEGRSR
jgi:hypothetical protein